jgi:hypothetical protein
MKMKYTEKLGLLLIIIGLQVTINDHGFILATIALGIFLIGLILFLRDGSKDE